LLDIEFLNKKASKFITFIKKTKELLNKGLDEFIRTPLYVDRAEYYILSASNELEEMACYLLRKLTKESKKENCLEQLAREQIFSDKVNRAILDLLNLKKNLFETGFKYPPEKLYPLLKDITDNLSENFLKELATLVKELKEREPKLKVPVNLKKVNEQAKAILGAKKKLQTFLNYSQDEFKSSDYAVDRSRYYLVVAVDGALWICRHLARKLELKAGKNCFDILYKEGYISEDIHKFWSKLADMRDKLVNPKEEVDRDFIYKLIKENLNSFDGYLKEISRIIFKGEKNG